ncbi:uncharacterized protein AB675_9541 [Cyphellophora attinorum]|uniref:Uncharacterized protein n=1 Tax=Cyphellophora attinorum TaxID=1664694 RepID=A0A0N0NPD0_9EURO|nr:uncharacterized protein AB675_9541 [Phialophora attinorum]KPI42399.1 hypothetical protein AB675_9541 [Phialophora attinorum]
MATSPNNTNSHLYPERRMRTDHQQSHRSTKSPGKTETSRYFAPSRPSEKSRPHETNDDGDDHEHTRSPPEDKSASSGRRQMLLTFSSSGRLGTRQPLKNPTPRSDAKRLSLADVAAETLSLLPGLLATRPDVGRDGHLIAPSSTSIALDSTTGLHLPATKIRVVDSDSITAALSLPSLGSTHPPPLVLNMANARHAGGGFKHGALAQEEALCYRSSLFFTLKIKHYPIPETGAIYSPRVLVIREDMSQGHNLLDFRNPAILPVLSVVSAAAIERPETRRLQIHQHGTVEVYARKSDEELMKRKMRTILRVAATHGHRQIVLGAFGCGAFQNPAHEVARMWAEVFAEEEFEDGVWWKDVIFAVLGQGTENFDAFDRLLAGRVV